MTHFAATWPYQPGVPWHRRRIVTMVQFVNSDVTISGQTMVHPAWTKNKNGKVLVDQDNWVVTDLITGRSHGIFDRRSQAEAFLAAWPVWDAEWLADCERLRVMLDSGTGYIPAKWRELRLEILGSLGLPSLIGGRLRVHPL